MSQSGSLGRLRESITEVVGFLFAFLMVLGIVVEPWLFVLGLVGMLFLTPIVALLFGDRDTVEEWWGGEKAQQLDTDTSQDDPLETLKRRYAEGELSEEEFEDKLNRLLESENVDMTDFDANHRESITEFPEEDDSEMELDEN
ncbi:hypothetical protein A6E15_07560 [Natrinema saccharevitans]|uniref:SHOCT domain-containing protein n=1 Tax=Natrinema saccharevitans TaxID=301967 RepID=A0A1S8AW04_9EURY|nr:SHOCT domain-containing protein [Natrinema saccharevitans]OLZ40855.1 hypothetical protein A6E15_07560 [Natrinema saccharevitans]